MSSINMSHSAVVKMCWRSSVLKLVKFHFQGRKHTQQEVLNKIKLSTPFTLWQTFGRRKVWLRLEGAPVAVSVATKQKTVALSMLAWVYWCCMDATWWHHQLLAVLLIRLLYFCCCFLNLSGRWGYDPSLLWWMGFGVKVHRCFEMLICCFG